MLDHPEILIYTHTTTTRTFKGIFFLFLCVCVFENLFPLPPWGSFQSSAGRAGNLFHVFAQAVCYVNLYIFRIRWDSRCKITPFFSYHYCTERQESPIHQSSSLSVGDNSSQNQPRPLERAPTANPPGPCTLGYKSLAPPPGITCPESRRIARGMCTQWWISVNCNVCGNRYTQNMAGWQICWKVAQGEVCGGTKVDWVDRQGGTCGECIVQMAREDRERREREGGEPTARYTSW